ncbi:MAG: polyprenyl synthetase family protein, partial [Alphaproteobacteria bacterium]|nr:polyprenyl synthetase family protein [Alphaproteobacteria bacterium]
RIRPLLLLETAALFDVPRATALPAALAIECVHVYSLIHDDLPCMDDDDLRRGKATVHKAFDEATAVLAGDALQALAFGLIAQVPVAPAIQVALLRTLAKAAGPEGMAGGQMIDMMAEAQTLSLAEITRLQSLKTGALIECAVMTGAILGDAASEASTALFRYAAAIGRAFQIADDILDFQGDAARAGKALKKDADAGKATFVSLLGVEAAQGQAALIADSAVDALAPFGPKADILRAIARYAVGRDH